MNVEIIKVGGIITRVLMVDELTPYTACENCGKPNYNHPDLAKEDADWCMYCNDMEHRANWSPEQYFEWTINQTINGKITMIGSREAKHGWKETDVKVARQEKEEDEV
tara:strand:- start:1463 stop:1786 length:324 start_codon:yes stop_codon:yes gene_type:complete